MKYRFPYIRPVFPAPPQWLAYLEQSYAAKCFSNFGPVVREFETALTRSFCGADEIITTASSCTAGLSGALIALDVRRTVLFPAFTFPATPAAIVMAGATPVALDVDADNWAMSTRSLERALERSQCDAVVLVVPFGIAQDFRKHFEICRRAGVSVVIDNAAGLGGPIGALPDESCFEVYSLHATKAFAIGEGGAIRSRASRGSDLHRALNFGLERGSAIEGIWGINGKLPEFSGAIGLAVLEAFPEVLRVRRSSAAKYVEIVSSFPTLKFHSDVRSAPWQTFPVLFPDREQSERFIGSASEHGVEVRRYYSPSLENWPRTKTIDDCPTARVLSQRMICLPMYSELEDSEFSELFSAIEACLSEALA